MLHRVQQIAPGLRVTRLHNVCDQTLSHQSTTALAGAGADVDDVLGVTYRVLVVLHHHQRVALVAQALQSTEQNLVVARMQADGRLVQYVADTLQVAAQLRCQPDALRLTAAERGRTPVQRQIAQANLFQKFQPTLDFRNQIARDVGLALAQPPFNLQRCDPLPDVGHAQAGNLGNANAIEAHGASRGIEPCALAGRTGRIEQILHLGLGEGLLPALVVVVAHRIVEDLALFFAQLDTGTDAVRTPAVLAVVGEQTRIELGVTGAAQRTGAFRRERIQRADRRG